MSGGLTQWEGDDSINRIQQSGGRVAIVREWREASATLAIKRRKFRVRRNRVIKGRGIGYMWFLLSLISSINFFSVDHFLATNYIGNLSQLQFQLYNAYSSREPHVRIDRFSVYKIRFINCSCFCFVLCSCVFVVGVSLIACNCTLCSFT